MRQLNLACCSQQCSVYKEQLLSLEVGFSCPSVGISYWSISYGSYKASPLKAGFSIDFEKNLKQLVYEQLPAL